MNEILLVSILQVIIALGLINVWLVRSGSKTKYRGAGAQNMKEEFKVYGLPIWFMYAVGFFKIVIAVVMLVDVFYPNLILNLSLPASILLAILMLGAISMHIKVKDSFVKMVPAISMLIMSTLVAYLLSQI